MDRVIQHDFLPAIVEDGLLHNRIIMLTEDITDSSAKTVIAKLMYLDSKSDDPIKIYIASAGGAVNAGLSIIDAIEACQCKVDIYAIGDCASMAFVILACATGKRKIFKHASLMYHELSSTSFGKFTDLKVEFERAEYLQNILWSLITEHTKITREMLDNNRSQDAWLTAEQAIELGVVDGIITRKD